MQLEPLLQIVYDPLRVLELRLELPIFLPQDRVLILSGLQALALLLSGFFALLQLGRQLPILSVSDLHRLPQLRDGLFIFFVEKSVALDEL